MNAAFFKSWISYFVVAIAILASASPAKAGIIVAGTEQDHLTMATDPMFQSVGWLRGVNSSGGFIAGSGVLISPEWILTAAHVVDNGWDSVAFSLDAYAGDPGRTLHATDGIYMYPGFVSDGGAGTNNDIALVHLSVPILGIVPADIYLGDVPLGTHAYWSGYGKLGYYPSGETNNAGYKRGGENVIDRIGWSLLGIQEQYLLADFGPAWGTETLPLEMGGSNGDSGSGWFADINGHLQLIGLATFIRGDFDNTGIIRPAMYSSWINEVTGTSVPEPSSALMMLMVVPFLKTRMRRLS